jgi:hypothetical protein
MLYLVTFISFQAFSDTESKEIYTEEEKVERIGCLHDHQRLLLTVAHDRILWPPQISWPIGKRHREDSNRVRHKLQRGRGTERER